MKRLNAAAFIAISLSATLALAQRDSPTVIRPLFNISGETNGLTFILGKVKQNAEVGLKLADDGSPQSLTYHASITGSKALSKLIHFTMPIAADADSEKSSPSEDLTFDGEFALTSRAIVEASDELRIVPGEFDPAKGQRFDLYFLVNYAEKTQGKLTLLIKKNEGDQDYRAYFVNRKGEWQPFDQIQIESNAKIKVGDWIKSADEGAMGFKILSMSFDGYGQESVSYSSDELSDFRKP